MIDRLAQNLFTLPIGVDLSRIEEIHAVFLCMEHGVNFFDTAEVYSDGQSEEILGKAIDHLRRDSVLISTKCAFRLGEGPNNTGTSRWRLMRSLEGSLR